MSARRAALVLACLAGGAAGCAQLLDIDHEYGDLVEDAGDAGEPEDGGEPGDAGSEPDATADADSGPAGFDCEMLDGLLWNDHCYFVISQGTGLIWTRARTTCESFSDSHLATLTSAAEEAAVEGAFFPATQDYWIGLALENPGTQTPPATCKTMPGSCPFRWVTGERLMFSKWSQRSGTDSEPNYTGACVRLQITDRSWADFGCGTQLPAICEHD
jgi:Lectin C-type domain